MLRRQKQKRKNQFFIDKIILGVAIIEPLFTLPQVIIIFRHKNATDVSIFTWFGFNMMTLMWIWYAIVHKEKVVLIYQLLFFLINCFVIIGAIMYGGQWL